MYFGTDGIRGEYGKEITPSLAFKCGCSLANLCKNKKVLIGKDTRLSNDVLSLSVANGLLSSGVNVIDVGVVPTPVVSYLAQVYGCDYGVMITASHNPPEHNGIKIFGSDGYKINENEEEKIEGFFSFAYYVSFEKLGHYSFQPNLVNAYINNVLKKCCKLDGLKIVLDCACGGTSTLAKKIFDHLGGKTIFLNCKNDGANINNNCGALHSEVMQNEVIKQKANVGFAFDGDGDRIVACDEKGNIIDGDDILSILANYLNNDEKKVVGTTMSNKGFENYLNKKGISLIRADVGDKYVAEIMKEKNISLGGEPSGHIIMKNFSKTGDGLLCACMLCQILKKEKTNLSNLVKIKKYPQVNVNVPVQDKFRVLNSEILAQKIIDVQKEFDKKGRILIRASGTENKIRIMVEHVNKKMAFKTAQEFESLVNLIK